MGADSGSRFRNQKTTLKNEVSTILLVEDDASDVILIKRAIRKTGIASSVHVIDNGDDAVEYLDGRGIYSDRECYLLPELLILDLKLPRRSGHEVLEWMKQQLKLRRLPVVVMSSSENTRDVNRAYDLGANSYLVKEASLNALFEKMKVLTNYWLVNNIAPEIE